MEADTLPSPLTLTLTLNPSLPHFAFFSISGSLSSKEDSERRGLWTLGHINDLLQTRNTECNIFG